MEESDLLKERLQAITEKHRIQESIRQKKLELDHEKLELQRLKKKVLKERWLLQDSAAHSASNITQIQSVHYDHQQTRALQLSIHKIEMEVDYLEREESMISVNESFILNRLKTVEKSPEDIIKEAQDSFVPDQFHVTTVVPEGSFSRAGSRHSEPSLATKNETAAFDTVDQNILVSRLEEWESGASHWNASVLFAMEINVAKNMLTGESEVLSTADVAPEDIGQHAGLKVFDDGTKCIYAFSPHEGVGDPSGAQELSASEVDHLLRSASEHRLLNHSNQRSLVSREERCFHNQRGGAGGHELRNHFSDHALRNNMAEREFSMSGTFQRRPQAERRRHQEISHSSLEDRNNQSNQRQQRGNHKGQAGHHGNRRDSHYSSIHVATLPSVESHGAAGQHAARSRMNGSRASGYPPPRSHDQEVVATSQPQLCYTPAHHIPLTDYISVDDEQLYCPSTAYHPPHRGSAHCDRPHSPFYGDDPPYTILNAMDTTEPITAIFMGFQMAMDDSGQMHGCDSALKAELVVIGDEQESCDGAGVQEKKSHRQPPPPAGSANGQGRGGAWTQRHGGAGISKIQKKHKACCSVC